MKDTQAGWVSSHMPSWQDVLQTPDVTIAAMGREASRVACLPQGRKLVLVLGWLAPIAVGSLWSRARGAPWAGELSLLAQSERAKYNPTWQYTLLEARARSAWPGRVWAIRTLCDCDLGKVANWVWCGLRRRRGVVGEDYHSKGRRNLGGGGRPKSHWCM